MFKELKMERMSENEINELPINDMPMVALLIKHVVGRNSLEGQHLTAPGRPWGGQSSRSKNFGGEGKAMQNFSFGLRFPLHLRVYIFYHG